MSRFLRWDKLFDKAHLTFIFVIVFILLYVIYNRECELSRNRRMDRAARLLVYQGEAEGPVSAEAPPWQGVKMLVAA